jgi:hypothetical protein
MRIPTNRETFERTTATFWFDEDGILNVKSKSGHRDIETVRSNGKFLDELLKGRKVCCLYDITSSGPLDKESRKLVKEQISRLYKAIGIITDSHLSKMLATIISVITPSSVPVKMFTDEEKAREWLQQHNKQQ